MPAERIAMRQVRDVLRLKAAGVSGNEIARRVGVAPSTVRLTLKRLGAAGLGWPLPAEMTDAVLEAQLFTAVGTKQGHRRRAEPDFAVIHRELKHKHITLQILWDEYIERVPDGYRYSRFCELYRGWASRVSVTMRQAHAGGDRLFVDYAGDTVPVIIDRLSGKTRPAQLFVAVMGASNFTYAEASWTQALADWISAHTRAFEAIGGVPNPLVPDNTIPRSCRPRRPRDKAKVETAVLIIERWLLGRLRHRRFYSLAELNAAIGEMLRRLNEEPPIRRLGAWTYVRDDRPFGGADPPAAVFYYSRDRRGEHPAAHLAGWSGVLQADAYGGYSDLYATERQPAPILEVSCCAGFRIAARSRANVRHGGPVSESLQGRNPRWSA